MNSFDTLEHPQKVAVGNMVGFLKKASAFLVPLEDENYKDEEERLKAQQEIAYIDPSLLRESTWSDSKELLAIAEKYDAATRSFSIMKTDQQDTLAQTVADDFDTASFDTVTDEKKLSKLSLHLFNKQNFWQRL
jgi:hypothetical protein